MPFDRFDLLAVTCAAGSLSALGPGSMNICPGAVQLLAAASHHDVTA
jgi:hypothetical protein